MTLTNKHNYHEMIVRAIRNDPYDKGDSEYSATGLIQPARIAALTKLYADQIEIDVDDEVFKLFGHLGHAIVERAGGDEFLREKRFFGTVDGVKISAQIDSLTLSGKTLTDWKFTTVFGFLKGSKPKPEWVWQMNIQLELLRQNNLDANKLEIVGILRDWRPAEAKIRKDYPLKVSRHDIPILARDKTLDYIRKRISEHRASEAVLPLCSEDEHWRWRRCRGYCQVAAFCDQFKNAQPPHEGHARHE